MRALGLAVGGVIFVICLLITYVLIWPVYAGWRDDAGYAAAYFDDLFPYDRVLYSKRWFWGHDSLGWGCTYAIVELPQPPADDPNARVTAGTEWNLRWGGDWQDTPAPPLGDTTRDAISSFADEWDADTVARLQSAMDFDGSRFMRDGVGETVLIYSVPQRIAARIRYGD